MRLPKHICTAALFLCVLAGFGQTKKQEAEFAKICSELVNAFAKKNIAGINKYINKETGVYVIVRPGAMDNFVNQKKLDAKVSFAGGYPYKDTTVVKKHSVKYGDVPKFNCGDMKWNKHGFVSDSSTKFSRIGDLMDFKTKNEQAKYSQEEIARKDAVEKRIRKVVFTDIAKRHGLVFYVSLMNGKWYLTIVDTVEGLCEA